MSKSRLITPDEWEEIHSLCYAIRCHWIGPMEGYEFMVFYLGGDKPLAFRKSERAAYNFIIRHSKQNPIDERNDTAAMTNNLSSWNPR